MTSTNNGVSCVKMGKARIKAKDETADSQEGGNRANPVAGWFVPSYWREGVQPGSACGLWCLVSVRERSLTANKALMRVY